MDPLHRLVCTSTLRDGDATCLPQVLRQARTTHSSLDITGVLVFDGSRFCQYLEGPQDGLDSVLQTIVADPRHTDFKIKAYESLEGGRRFPNYPMAFALTIDTEALDLFDALDSHSAFDALNELLPSLDLGYMPPELSDVPQ